MGHNIFPVYGMQRLHSKMQRATEHWRLSNSIRGNGLSKFGFLKNQKFIFFCFANFFSNLMCKYVPIMNFVCDSPHRLFVSSPKKIEKFLLSFLSLSLSNLISSQFFCVYVQVLDTTMSINFPSRRCFLFIITHRITIKKATETFQILLWEIIRKITGYHWVYQRSRSFFCTER